MITTASTLEPDQLEGLPPLMQGNICRCTGYRSITRAISQGLNCPAESRGAPEPGPTVGCSVKPPAAGRVVTGTEPYTFDTALPGTLYLRVLGSPHAHARITSIDTSDAERTSGVELVLTHENVPGNGIRRPGTRTGWTSGRHPDDR